VLTHFVAILTQFLAQIRHESSFRGANFWVFSVQLCQADLRVNFEFGQGYASKMAKLWSFRQDIKLHKSKPSFPGILRGEIFKITHQWTTWVMLVLLLGVIGLPFIIIATSPNVIDDLRNTPLSFFYNEMEICLSLLRVFIGIFLLILTARVIGLEYHLGTIRILLARGVGRLQLLSAQLLAIAIVALTLFAGGILLDGILTCGLVAIVTGNLNALNVLTSTFWSSTWLYVLSVLISMGVAILIGYVQY
jgi:ABC-type transport system involved in multi-copper enzyme maturation permease subunit